MKAFSATRLFSLVLVFVLLSSLFLVACQGDSTTQTQTGENGITLETEDTSDPAGIFESPAKDLQGHTFMFLTRNNTANHLNHNEVFASGINGEKVNDAVFKRNSELQKLYNCTIAEERDNTPQTTYLDALISGEYVADFLFITATAAKNLAQKSLLVDWKGLNTLDLEKNWYDQESNLGLNMAGKIFFLTGDACTVDDRWCTAIYYNIEVVQLFEPQADLYQEVRDGKWTIDRMLQIIEGTVQDMDGDGQIATYNKDRYGYVCGNTVGNWAHVVGCGVRLSEIDANGTIDIPLAPSRELLDTWEALRELITTPYRMSVDGGAGLPSGSAFRSGMMTFYACNLGALLNWGDQSFHLGVLPYPKRNVEQQYYYTNPSYNMGGYCIPSSAENDTSKDWIPAGFDSAAERNAYFFDAFSYYSMNTLTPAFFEQVINKQIIMDADTAEMIEIALDHRIYDPVVFYNFGDMRTLFADVGGINDHPGTDINYDTFVSEYSSRVTKAREAVASYLTFIDASTSVL